MGLSLPEDVRKELRQRLLSKGGEVANKLAKVLAGQNVRLENITVRGTVSGEGVGMTKEEKLRAYLDLINRRRQLLERDDVRFLRCAECDVELSLAAARESPWLGPCSKHD